MKAADAKHLEPIRRDPSRYGFSFDADTLAEPFAAPTLIVTGRQDTIVGYRDAWRIVENYPRATFAVLDRADHGLPIDQDALFRALVNDWLDRVEEARALADEHDVGFEQVGLARRWADEYLEDAGLEYRASCAVEECHFAGVKLE